MSHAVDVRADDAQDDIRTEDDGHATILPAPTMPPALLTDVRPGDQATSAPRAGLATGEAPDNKKPYLLVRLGHRLCGFR